MSEQQKQTMPVLHEYRQFPLSGVTTAMNEQRKQILEMLREGKITVDDAERLMDALSRSESKATSTGLVEAAPVARPSRKDIRYLRVHIQERGKDGEMSDRVNVRVPVSLLRAGVKFSALLPKESQEQVSKALGEKGIPIDFTKMDARQIEELIDSMGELTVDVGDDNSSVRVFFE